MYIVLKSFSGEGGTYAEGMEIESIPQGVDWVKAGFVEEMKPAKTTKKTPAKKAPKKPTK